jgi:hypothetical protein
MPADLRPLLDAPLAVFGVTAIVTRPVPDDAPVSTTGIWVAPQPDTQPTSRDVHRQTGNQILVVPRADLPTLPRETRIVAPEQAGAVAKTWRVVGFERAEVDHWRAIVTVVEDP